MVPQKLAKRGDLVEGSSQIIVRRLLQELCCGFNWLFIYLFTAFICNSIKSFLAGPMFPEPS